MTDSSGLFQEIQEDLDRQKLEAWWKRYGVLVIAGAVAIVLITTGVTWWHAWRDESNQRATAGLLAIMKNKTSNVEKQIEFLEDFASKHRGDTPAALARLHAASLAVQTGGNDQAVKIYDAVAGDSSIDTAFRQLADLLSVQTQMDSADPAVLIKRLSPLEAENAPWRLTAMEYEGYLALRAGDKVKAKQLFTTLSQDAAVPPSLRSRAVDMLRFVSE